VALDTTVAIDAPEHIRFEVRVAGPAPRMLAYAIDLAIRTVVAAVFFVLLALADAAPDSVGEATTGVMLLALFALEWGYFVVAESLGSGQSPGKRFVGLRVIDEAGCPATFLAIVLRNLLRAADGLPFTYAVGLLVMAGDRRFRRLGDWVAGTMVVVDTRARAVAALRIEPAPSELELDPFPLDLRLSGADVDAIEAFLRRARTLGVLRGRELAEMIAPIHARRLAVSYEDPARFLALLYHRATVGIDASRSHAALRAGGMTR
jgi:uncharacterized RDD family membrane protein YckC